MGLNEKFEDQNEIFPLKSTGEMSAEEALAMFLWTCAHNESNRNVQNRFKHSGETISRKFGEVLDCVVRFSVDIVRPTDIEFKEVPEQICNNDKFWSHFKGCIGAIDGTHVRAMVLAKDLVQYIGRRGYPTQNVMVVCNFDLRFTFVVAGWPGCAHDARIFAKALEDYGHVFPHPPDGEYYLVDAGYPNMKGYLAPYKEDDVRYHLADYRRGNPPEGYKEVFNYAHACLRNAVEQTIGVWKNRFEILLKMQNYLLVKKNKIVVATMTLHNYIRKHAIEDEEFDRCDCDPFYMPQVDGEDNIYDVFSNVTNSQHNIVDDGNMVAFRNSSAMS